jgi:hypothetical protein
MKRNAFIPAVFIILAIVGAVAFCVVSFFRGLDRREADNPFFAKVYDTILILEQKRSTMQKADAQLALDLALRDVRDQLYRKYFIGYECHIDTWESTNRTFWIVYAGEDGIFGTSDDGSNRWTLAELGKRHGLDYTNPPDLLVDLANTLGTK